MCVGKINDKSTSTSDALSLLCALNERPSEYSSRTARGQSLIACGECKHQMNERHRM
jgi:hypothetical protein